ncbi:MAG: hypothetical protein E7466_06085 [Ruminococcaceae bacterium]|nr:hypothetical protein [Oscillospiraceae bacterium]
MNCPNCGTPMGAEDVFCANCNAPISALTTPSVEPEQTPDAITPDVPVKKKSKKKKIIIITAIVTVLAIIAGILSWVFIFSKETVYALVSQKHYTVDGINYEYYTYEYDDKGNLLREEYDHGSKHEEVLMEDGLYSYVIHKSPVDGSELRYTEYEYNKQGHLIRSRWDNGLGQFSDSTYEYQLDGNRITEISKTTSSEYMQTTEQYSLEYDNDNQLVKVKRKNRDGAMSDLLIMEYDEQSRLTALTSYEYHTDSVHYEYNGDLLTKIRAYAGSMFDGPSQTSNFEYEYDSEGKLTNANKTQYHYDSKGNLISVKDDSSEYVYRYNGHKIIGGSWNSESELEYDKNGNLIKVTEADGSYAILEYKELRLDKEDAARFHAQEQVRQRLSGSLFSDSMYYRDYFSILPVLYTLVDMPIDPAYGTGPMHRGK